MDFGLSEEQQQLKESARAFLTGECPTTFVRKVMATDDGYPRELYDQIAKLGWTGLVVPEKFGGAGLGMLDMAMVLEEGGYAAMPGPFMFSSMLAASALKLSGSDQLKSKWLPRWPRARRSARSRSSRAPTSIDARDINAIGSKGAAGWHLPAQDVRAVRERRRLHRRRRANMTPIFFCSWSMRNRRASRFARLRISI